MITAQRTYVQRIGYLVTCVLPADLLSDESDAEDSSSLRTDASQDNLTWMQVKYQLEDDLYVARVASSPTLVANGNAYTVILSEEQLLYALAWDARLEWEDHLHTRKRRPEAILALLRAHAREVRPLTRETALPPLPVAAHAAALTPLETVEVSTREVRAAFKHITQDELPVPTQEQHTTQYFMQQALFQAMIDRLMGQLYQTEEQAQALVLKARCGLLAQLQRWHRTARWERVIHVARHRSPGCQQGMWRLTVGVPDLAVA
jgi:hypothetical protein